LCSTLRNRCYQVTPPGMYISFLQSLCTGACFFRTIQ
jgi:hypothetical protein